MDKRIPVWRWEAFVVTMNKRSRRSPRQMRRAVRRSLRLAAGALALGLAGTAGLMTAGAQAVSQPAGARPAGGASVTPMIDISSRCTAGGNPLVRGNAEVEEAAAAPGYVYADWMGCGGIGFARSTDGGLHFSKPVTVPGSAGASWDPAIAVAPNGTVYVS